MKRLFVDMDGTLAEWREQDASTLSELMNTLCAPGYYASLAPYLPMIKALKDFKKNNPDVEIHILSSYLTDQPYPLFDKKLWVKKYLPEFLDGAIFVPYGESKAAYIGKLTKDDYLLDDHTPNLFDWIKHGGTAIKVLNPFNHKKGRWGLGTIQATAFISKGYYPFNVGFTRQSLEEIAKTSQLVQEVSPLRDSVTNEITGFVCVLPNGEPMTLTRDNATQWHRELSPTQKAGMTPAEQAAASTLSTEEAERYLKNALYSIGETGLFEELREANYKAIMRNEFDTHFSRTPQGGWAYDVFWDYRDEVSPELLTEGLTRCQDEIDFENLLWESYDLGAADLEAWNDIQNNLDNLNIKKRYGDLACYAEDYVDYEALGYEGVNPNFDDLLGRSSFRVNLTLSAVGEQWNTIAEKYGSWAYLEWTDGDPSTQEPDALTWLVGSQGYTIEDVYQASKINQSSICLQSVVDELDGPNGNSNYNLQLTALMTVTDPRKLFHWRHSDDDLELPKGTTIGLFDPDNGGGSSLEIELEKDRVLIPHPLVAAVQVEPCGTRFGLRNPNEQASGYTVDDTYGLVRSCWDTEFTPVLHVHQPERTKLPKVTSQELETGIKLATKGDQASKRQEATR